VLMRFRVCPWCQEGAVRSLGSLHPALFHHNPHDIQEFGFFGRMVTPDGRSGHELWHNTQHPSCTVAVGVQVMAELIMAWRHDGSTFITL
jgi:hypothetical protein